LCDASCSLRGPIRRAEITQGFLNLSHCTMKYVVVTGGVVSGLGKGISISSLGVLLKSAGFRVTSKCRFISSFFGFLD